MKLVLYVQGGVAELYCDQPLQAVMYDRDNDEGEQVFLTGAYALDDLLDNVPAPVLEQIEAAQEEIEEDRRAIWEAERDD